MVTLFSSTRFAINISDTKLLSIVFGERLRDELVEHLLGTIAGYAEQILEGKWVLFRRL